MIKEENVLTEYMNLLNPLSVDLKLKLIAKLSESITFEFKKKASKSEDWKKLYGAWSDEDFVDKIYENRLPNREVPNFDL